MGRWTTLIGAVLALGLSHGALAQEVSSNAVSTTTDWTVFVEDNPRECWSVSMPKETVNTKNGVLASVDRGDIRLMVFFRPGASPNAQVAFTGGYTFKEDTFVEVQIDGSTFSFFTEGEWAWPASESDDAKIIVAMKRGASAVVTGLSRFNTTTKDTFSLLGFTASVEDAEKRCAP